MRSVGVSFATLGNEEKCCGEPARRLGNEYLFQALAGGNIEVMNGYHLAAGDTQRFLLFRRQGRHKLLDLCGSFGSDGERDAQLLHVSQKLEFLKQQVDGSRSR